MTTHTRSIHLFEGLTGPEREQLGRHLTEKRFEPGEPIFGPGDACLKVFFVRSGRIRVKRASGCGREQTLDILKAGDSCACHPDGEDLKCASYAEAVTACSVWFMPRAIFSEWVRKNHAFSQSLSRHLAGKLLRMGSLVEDLTLADARSRLARHILRSAVPDDDNEGLWTLRASQESLAKDIGVTRETVARQLSGLRRARVIATHPRRVVILDRAALKKIT